MSVYLGELQEAQAIEKRIWIETVDDMEVEMDNFEQVRWATSWEPMTSNTQQLLFF